MRKIATIIVIGIFLLCAGNAFAKHGFSGVVQAMPEGGYAGQWIFDGKMVYVTENTKIEHGKLAVGSYVEVEGVIVEGNWIAHRIKIKNKR